MVDPKRIFPTCSGTGIIWAFCRCGARFCGGFLPILPVQNGEKAIDIITKRVYDVSSHVPSWWARFLQWVVRHLGWPRGAGIQLVDLTGVFLQCTASVH